ncbi:MAG TPA: hypothetical protein VHX12_03430 [Acidisoma sp.]|jgi:hypothetical protein|nr:hypothetical protein [Acidisoma sp.]
MISSESRAGARLLYVGAVLLSLASWPSGADAAMTETEVWRGAYQCAQGLTGVTLTLLLQPGGQAQGLFEFYPVTANPAVPEGCFEMSGVMDHDRLTLSPGPWRLQPPGYVTVGLTGREIDAKRMIGTIEGPGCAGFALVRQIVPAEPSACASVAS